MPMTSYLTLEGESQGPMEGDCEQSGRENTILVYAMDHMVEIPRDSHTGLPTGQRIHHPLVITKHLDPASPLICQACCTGEHLKKFELDFYHINPQGLEENYYKISLEDSIVVQVETFYPETFLEQNKPFLHMEKVSFTYSKITWSHVSASKEATDDWKSPAQ